VTKILFVHNSALGFSTVSRGIERACQGRPDVQAVHLSPPMPWWVRAAAAQSPLNLRGYDFHTARLSVAWAAHLRGELSQPGVLDGVGVVHVLSQQRGAIAAWLKTRGIPCVVNIDSTDAAWNEAFGYRTARPDLNKRVECRTLRAAAAVACWSQWAADSVVRDYGVPTERVFLHRPCEGPFLTPRPAGRRGGGPLRIVFVGNDWERKGGPRVLAWHQQRWVGNAEFHVCSRTAPRDDSCKGVVWHGAVPHERLVDEVLPSMDVLVMPTIRDTFMIAAQEAQAAGLAVVTSRIAGLKELVVDGVTGVLASPSDDAAFIAAVDRLISDEAGLEAMCAASKRHAVENLDGRVWYGHLLDQVIAVAEGRGVTRAPSDL